MTNTNLTGHQFTDALKKVIVNSFDSSHAENNNSRIKFRRNSNEFRNVFVEKILTTELKKFYTMKLKFSVTRIFLNVALRHFQELSQTIWVYIE